MIRNELKQDPTGFVSRNLEGVRLNLIEELYLVSKCPNLFNFILDPKLLTQRLYLFKESAIDLSISNISDTRLIKKALRKRPEICIELDIIEFEKDIYNCIDSIHKNRDIYILERLLTNEDVPNSILRKILLLEPRLVKVAIQSGIINFDQDIEMYMFKTNPLLLENFKRLSAITATKILKMGIENVVYIRNWLDDIDRDILILETCDYIMKYRTDCKYTFVAHIISSRPDIFSDVIKTLYKNGFNMNTNFTIRLLLKEFNELINEDIAETIIESGE